MNKIKGVFDKVVEWDKNLVATFEKKFNDGGQFGLGAEVAISTNKMHARGPMGLKELTSYKWVVLGMGHIRP